MIYKTLLSSGILLSGLISAGAALPQPPTVTNVAEMVVMTRTLSKTISSDGKLATTTATEPFTAVAMGPSGVEYHESTVTEVPAFETATLPAGGEKILANMTKLGLADSSCTFSASQLTPTDIPTVNPYVSPRGVNYYPAGSQNGMILREPEYISGPGYYPASNSFAAAASECSDFCDIFDKLGHGPCLSFNVLTVYEGDFNNCLPTFECRFNAKIYDPADYTLDNGLPSYVWTLKDPNAQPTCDLSKPYSPSNWVISGIDDWLQSYSRQNGYTTLTTGFMSSLMGSLKWSGYDCDGPAAADSSLCVDALNNNAAPCANWINRQADLYFTYIDNIYKTFNAWQAFMNNQGASVYQAFWNKNPPASSGFDYHDFIETTINCVLGAIPDVGSIIQGIVEIGESLASSWPTDAQVQGPNTATAWNDHISAISTALTTFTGAMMTNGTATGGTSAMLDVLRGGSYFLQDADPITIDADTVWTNYFPYYTVQTAVAAMQAQGVFFMRVPISGMEVSSCSQSIADKMANFFGSDSQNTAWCDTDGAHVIIPVNGWNGDSYRSLNAVYNAPMKLTPPQVGESAMECFAGFGPSNATISPYSTVPIGNFDFLTSIPDLSSECMWPIPVCDYDTWANTARAQSTTEGGYGYKQSCDGYYQTFGDEVTSVASWCGYQMGLRTQINWCATNQMPNVHTGCEIDRMCQNYKWTKKITVN